MWSSHLLGFLSSGQSSVDGEGGALGTTRGLLGLSLQQKMWTERNPAEEAVGGLAQC